MLHTVTVLAFTITGLLIVPFVKIYTKGVTDADYVVPVFAVLITCATASYCLRLPYSMMVLAAGHYKQTQNSAIIEMVLNIVVSVALVFWLGLVGVAIGTLISMTYRTVYYALYLRKNILNRKLSYFLKHIAVDLIMIICMVSATFWIKITAETYLSWVVAALEVSGICLVITVALNLIFYRKTLFNTFRLFFNKTKEIDVK